MSRTEPSRDVHNVSLASTFPVVLFMTGGRLSCLTLLTLLDLLIQLLLVDFPPPKKCFVCTLQALGQGHGFPTFSYKC